MAHDYAKKPRPKTSTKKTPAKPRARSRQSYPPKKTVPGWVWLFVGTAVGAFVMFLVRLADVDISQVNEPSTAKPVITTPITNQPKPVAKTTAQPKPAGSKAAASTKPSQSQQNSAVQAKPEPQKPRFDFYHMLKENEVPVNAGSDREGVTQAIAPPRSFILQVASFRSAGDAEQLKVELILMNLEARSEQVTVRNGEVWYRVLIGPFESRSELAKARSQLISNGHQALVMEYKGQ